MIELAKGKHKNTLRVILTIVITAIIAAVYFTVTTFISARQGERNMWDNLIKEGEQTVSQASQAITMSAEAMEKDLYLVSKNEALQRLLNESKDEAIEGMLAEFKSFKDNNPAVENIYLGTEDKKMYLFPKQQLPQDYDPTGRPWYKNAVNNMNLTWSETYTDASTGNTIISLSIPIYNGDKIAGVLSVDLILDLMLEKAKDMKLGGTGYMIMTDQNGVMIMHPNKEMIGWEIPFEGLRDLIDKEDMGIIRYTYQNVEETAIYSKINKLKLNLIGLIKK